MCWTGHQGTPGVAGKIENKYCPRCGGEYIMYKSNYNKIKWSDSTYCLSFGCNWLGVKEQLLNEKQKLLFVRRKKLKEIENENKTRFCK